MTSQSNWRWRDERQGTFSAGNPLTGSPPTGDDHDTAGQRDHGVSRVGGHTGGVLEWPVQADPAALFGAPGRDWLVGLAGCLSTSSCADGACAGRCHLAERRRKSTSAEELTGQKEGEP